MLTEFHSERLNGKKITRRKFDIINTRISAEKHVTVGVGFEDYPAVIHRVNMFWGVAVALC
jgi:hypothetical protein